jgi:hypothetical protein
VSDDIIKGTEILGLALQPDRDMTLARFDALRFRSKHGKTKPEDEAVELWVTDEDERPTAVFQAPYHAFPSYPPLRFEGPALKSSEWLDLSPPAVMELFVFYAPSWVRYVVALARSSRANRPEAVPFRPACRACRGCSLLSTSSGITVCPCDEGYQRVAIL